MNLIAEPEVFQFFIDFVNLKSPCACEVDILSAQLLSICKSSSENIGTLRVVLAIHCRSDVLKQLW